MSDRLKVQQEEEEEEEGTEVDSITSPDASFPGGWSDGPPLVSLKAAPGGEPP